MAKAAELRIKVTELRSNDGDVHVAVYDRPESFPKGGAMAAEKVMPASPDGVLAAFAGLAPGAYAVAVYHDENANHDFDQGIFGIPLEGYAFSNGAAVFLGPPDFAEAAVRLGSEGTEIIIPMTY